MDDRSWYLIGKMLSKEATGDELKELRELCSSDAEIPFYIGELSKWWSSTEECGGEASEKAFQKHLQNMRDKDLLMPSGLKDILEKGKDKK